MARQEGFIAAPKLDALIAKRSSPGETSISTTIEVGYTANDRLSVAIGGTAHSINRMAFI